MEGKILPLYVLAKEIQQQEKTERGIFIPIVSKQPTVTADVILIGSGTKNEDMIISIGDKILFSQHAFRKFAHPLDKQEYLLVAQKDVLLIW
jgi:chaperonin GroES